MEYVNDYAFVLQYHPGNAKVVADALSRKSGVKMSSLALLRWEMWNFLEDYEIYGLENEERVHLYNSLPQDDFPPRVVEAQLNGLFISPLIGQMTQEPNDWYVAEDGGMRYKGRIVVPEGPLRQEILENAHRSKFSIHPGTTKMYHDLKRCYWWRGMKRDVADYVKRCLTCQQVKAEHQRPAGLTNPLPIPVWKWEHVTMDFVVGLPVTPKARYDAIWVVVDRLTKTAHFILMRTTDSISRLAQLYINSI
ncbi:hypothetical protein DVA67_035545, partial [Solirubrobacter sp. CPCC 204708]|nr:hypothetical protein [Solirubrobacter deserti]